MQPVILVVLILASLAYSIAGGQVCPLFNPTPPYANCGRYVRLTQDHNATTIYSNITFDDCVNLCLQETTPLCTDFVWAPHSSKCYIQVVPDYYFNHRIIPATFEAWDRSCWDCPMNCPPPSGVNLAINPGFETGTRLPFGTWPNASTVVSPGSNSTNALYFKTPRDGENSRYWSMIYQYVLMCSGYWYRLTFDVKFLEHGSNYTDLQAASYFSLYPYNTSFDAPPEREWYTSTMFLLGGLQLDGDLPYFYVRVFDTQAVEFDNFNFHAVKYPLGPKPGAVSMLKNGGFESGSLQPWQAPDSLSPRIISPGINSQYAVNLTSTNGEISLVQQPLAWTQGQGYLLTMDVITEYALQCQITTLVSRWTYIYCANNGTITHVEYPFTVGNLANAGVQTYLENTTIYCYIDNGAPSGWVVLDNISITEIDDPN